MFDSNIIFCRIFEFSVQQF